MSDFFERLYKNMGVEIKPVKKKEGVKDRNKKKYVKEEEKFCRMLRDFDGSKERTKCIEEIYRQSLRLKNLMEK